MMAGKPRARRDRAWIAGVLDAIGASPVTRAKFLSRDPDELMDELRTEEARIEAKARELDPDAFTADPTDRWMERRRIHAWTLASGEEISRGDPRIAAALYRLYDRTRH